MHRDDDLRSVDLGRALFRRLHRWCRAHGAPLFVLTTGYQPWHFSRVDPAGRRGGDYAFYEQAEAFFEEEGIAFEDLSNEMLQASSGKREAVAIAQDGHPNEEGSRLIATYTWRWLRPRLRDLAGAAGREKSARRP